MAEYIDKQKFLEEQRHLYCENCDRRKGVKRGRMQFVYEIGDAPCRACGYGDVLDDLEDFPAADVRPVVRNEKKILDVTCGDRTIWFQKNEPHLTAACWNALWALEMMLVKPEMDDRPKEGQER